MSEQPEGSPETAPGAAPAAELTPDVAQAEIKRLSVDPAFQKDLLSGFGAGHRTALEKWQTLQRTAHSTSDNIGPAERVMADALKAPATPADYKINVDQAVADWDSGLEGEARKLAHATGMSNGQLDGLVMLWNKAAEEYKRDGPPSAEKSAAAHDQALTALRAKHGHRAEAVIERANSVIKALPDHQRKRVNELINSYGLNNSAWLTDQLALLAERKAGR